MGAKLRVTRPAGREQRIVPPPEHIPDPGPTPVQENVVGYVGLPPSDEDPIVPDIDWGWH